MLNKSDLKAIENVLDSKLDQKLEAKLSKLETSLDQKFEQKLKPIKTNLRKIRKDLKTTINFFDKDYIHLGKRVKRIGQNLDLPSLPAI